MAITIDATSNGHNATATTLTIAHTVAATATVLIVGFWQTSDGTVVGATYNGAAMTSRKVSSKSTNLGGEAYLYTIYSSETTFDGSSHNIVITFTGAVRIAGGGLSLKGTRTSWLGTEATNSGADSGGSYSTIAATLTTNLSGSLAVGMLVGGTVTNVTADVSSVLRWQENTYGAGGIVTQPKVGAGALTETLTYDSGTADSRAWSIIEIPTALVGQGLISLL